MRFKSRLYALLDHTVDSIGRPSGSQEARWRVGALKAGRSPAVSLDSPRTRAGRLSYLRWIGIEPRGCPAPLAFKSVQVQNGRFIYPNNEEKHEQKARSGILRSAAEARFSKDICRMASRKV